MNSAAICVCTCVRPHMHTRVCLYWVWVWRSGDNLVESVLSCHLDVCSADQTQVTRLGLMSPCRPSRRNS